MLRAVNRRKIVVDAKVSRTRDRGRLNIVVDSCITVHLTGCRDRSEQGFRVCCTAPEHQKVSMHIFPKLTKVLWSVVMDKIVALA